ncbi:hypothetical protein [Streptomyces sp. NPDC004788]
MTGTATVRLHIENRYESGMEIVTTPTATVPIPVPMEGTEAREEWDYDHIFPHTGTGWTEGDSWYDVEIVESTASELVGMTFEFGY